MLDHTTAIGLKDKSRTTARVGYWFTSLTAQKLCPGRASIVDDRHAAVAILLCTARAIVDHGRHASFIGPVDRPRWACSVNRRCTSSPGRVGVARWTTVLNDWATCGACLIKLHAHRACALNARHTLTIAIDHAIGACGRTLCIARRGATAAQCAERRRAEQQGEEVEEGSCFHGSS